MASAVAQRRAAKGRVQHTLPSPPRSAAKPTIEQRVKEEEGDDEGDLHDDRGSGTSPSASGGSVSHRASTEESSAFSDAASQSSREAQEVAEALTAECTSGKPAKSEQQAQWLLPTPPASEDGDRRAAAAGPARPAYLYLSEDTQCEAPQEPTDDIAGVPVFTPTWDDFKDFYSYCQSIDEWGMRSGIVKIIPPKEWTESLPRLDGRGASSSSTISNQAGACYTGDNRLSQVRIKNSIEQIFTPGGMGVWRQSNVVHPARIVNAKQWADTCAAEERHGPDMNRMKAMAQRSKGDYIEAAAKEDGVRTRSGRGSAVGANGSQKAGSRSQIAKLSSKRKRAAVDDSSGAGPSASRSPEKATSAVNKPKMAERTTQSEWNDFDYINDWCREAGQDTRPEDWSAEVCQAIEREYWRGLNYGKPPMYGADLAGTLFTDETKHWNVGKLDNILTRLRLRRKLPGVTTPYLYFGMWRATFAWHVEDMDLYSINYIHFGAPKQWYSIRQADKQRFELAMAGAFPADSGRCRHFMRHKSYLASPAFLNAAAGSVKPLRLVQKAQEFVITYPYGYHSGYNLGFNCAESVNFALERWLDIGRKAGYCDCTDDSVKMDVDAMLEESKEMEELERKRIERERRKDEEELVHQSEAEKQEAKRAKERERRQRRKEEQRARGDTEVEADNGGDEGGAPPTKKAKLASELPCIFCVSRSEDDLVYVPNEEAPSSRTDVGRYAHRLCASFLPETWVAANPAAGKGSKQPKELVMGFAGIPKARWSLKCQLCTERAMQKRGAKVQCTYGKCSRTTHVGCALEDDSGWCLDVLSDLEADALEGQKDGKRGKETATRPEGMAEDAEENDGPAPRLVILCHNHNPETRQSEARRRAEILRLCAQTLVTGQNVLVRTGSGTWETRLRTVKIPEGPLRIEPTRSDDDTMVAQLEDATVVPISKLILAPNVIKHAEAVYEELETARLQRMEEDSQRAVLAVQARHEAREAGKRARKAALEEKRVGRGAQKATRAAPADTSSAVAGSGLVQARKPPMGSDKQQPSLGQPSPHLQEWRPPFHPMARPMGTPCCPPHMGYPYPPPPMHYSPYHLGHPPHMMSFEARSQPIFMADHPASPGSLGPGAPLTFARGPPPPEQWMHVQRPPMPANGAPSPPFYQPHLHAVPPHLPPYPNLPHVALEAPGMAPAAPWLAQPDYHRFGPGISMSPSPSQVHISLSSPPQVPAQPKKKRGKAASPAHAPGPPSGFGPIVPSRP